MFRSACECSTWVMVKRAGVAGLVARAESVSGVVVPDRRRAARVDGWSVRYELVVMDGDAADLLMSRQAAVVREALEYFVRLHQERSGTASEPRATSVSGTAAR